MVHVAYQELIILLAPVHYALSPSLNGHNDLMHMQHLPNSKCFLVFGLKLRTLKEPIKSETSQSINKVNFFSWWSFILFHSPSIVHCSV